jgi:hypothetical protein
MQLELAGLGVATCQTDTGVKDKYTSYAIQKLLTWSRAKKKSEPHLTYKAIGEELNEWWRGHEEEVINPFLRTRGKSKP